MNAPPSASSGAARSAMTALRALKQVVGEFAFRRAFGLAQLSGGVGLPFGEKNARPAAPGEGASGLLPRAAPG
jgi:hypothetical protein